MKKLRELVKVFEKSNIGNIENSENEISYLLKQSVPIFSDEQHPRRIGLIDGDVLWNDKGEFFAEVLFWDSFYEEYKDFREFSCISSILDESGVKIKSFNWIMIRKNSWFVKKESV